MFRTTMHSANFPRNLDLQHKQFSTMQEGRFAFAPLENPQFAVDVAGGTGVWAFEFGMSTHCLLSNSLTRTDSSLHNHSRAISQL